MGQSWLQTTLGVPELFWDVQTANAAAQVNYVQSKHGEAHSPAYFTDGMHDPQSMETTNLLLAGSSPSMDL